MPEEKVTRNLLAQYYGITVSSTTTYTQMGTGFVKLTEENSPQVDNTAYVNNRNDSPTIIGYQNKWAYEAQYIEGNAVCDDLAAIARDQKTGTDCERLMVDVELHNAVTGEGITTTYRARKFAVAVEATGPNGDPKSITKLTGNLHQIGDVVKGTFNTTTKTFTADA